MPFKLLNNLFLECNVTINMMLIKYPLNTILK